MGVGKSRVRRRGLLTAGGKYIEGVEVGGGGRRRIFGSGRGIEEVEGRCRGLLAEVLESHEEGSDLIS